MKLRTFANRVWNTDTLGELQEEKTLELHQCLLHVKLREPRFPKIQEPAASEESCSRETLANMNFNVLRSISVLHATSSPCEVASQRTHPPVANIHSLQPRAFYPFCSECPHRNMRFSPTALFT